MFFALVACVLMLAAVCALVAFSIFSRTDDLRHPAHLYTTRHRVARRLAGATVIRRD